MHARLEADGALIVASDGRPDYPAQVGENMGIALGGTDKDRLTKIVNDLAEGALGFRVISVSSPCDNPRTLA
jgi:uncharacterized glyoxalase superfamily protein PhnB